MGLHLVQHNPCHECTKISLNVHPPIRIWGPTDYASTVKKLAAQDSGLWKYERNGYAEGSNGSSRSTSLYSSVHVKSSYGERMHSRGSTREVPTWLDTVEVVGLQIWTRGL